MTKPNSTNITDLIKHLTQLEGTLEAKRQKDEADNAALVSKSLANLIGLTVNDNAAPMVLKAITPIINRKARRTAIKKSARGGVRKLEDTDLIDALTTRFQTPPQIVANLAEMGISISKASVYARMPILAELLTDEIEEQTSPMAWRIKRKSIGGADVGPRATKVRGRVNKASPKGRGKPPRAANDQIVANDQFTFIQGDCLEVMRRMESKSISVVVTSPPYNISGTQKRGGRWPRNRLAEGGYRDYPDDMPYPEYVKWQHEVLRECWRLLKDDGAIFYNHKQRPFKGHWFNPLDLIPPELLIRQVIIWDRGAKPFPNPTVFASQHENIILIAKPAYRLAKFSSSIGDVWRINPERKNPHPAAFPVEIPSRCIEHSRNVSVVLDPFCGSGSTAVAAHENGCSFIGIDLSDEYLDMGRERVSQIAS